MGFLHKYIIIISYFKLLTIFLLYFHLAISVKLYNGVARCNYVLELLVHYTSCVLFNAGSKMFTSLSDKQKCPPIA